jgi:hypothetical protein
VFVQLKLAQQLNFEGDLAVRQLGRGSRLAVEELVLLDQKIGVKHIAVFASQVFVGALHHQLLVGVGGLDCCYNEHAHLGLGRS